MKRRTFDFSFRDLGISIDQIGKLIDYDKGENREMIAGMISDVLKEAELISSVKAEYVIYNDIIAESTGGSIIINGIDFNVGKIVRGQLKKSGSVAIFLCTAGPEIGDLARRLINEKDFLKGYIFDIAGSEIVEAAGDKMQEALRLEMLAENKLITNRYSPGYCGWHLSEQQKLFTLVPGNYCNISLTDSSLMQPIKSISGFIGIGENVRYNQYTCNLCDMQNCIYRKHKNNK
jgi:hypothetical protein